MIDESLIGVLLPQLSGVDVTEVSSDGAVVVIRAVTRDGPMACPDCGIESARVHARYERLVSDVAMAGRAVSIRLLVRRIRCGSVDCGRFTFAEQVPGLTFSHGRRTVLARQVLLDIAGALAGRAGARLAGRLCLPAGKSTLLRWLHALSPWVDPQCPPVIGIDDFALRKGMVYGTIIIDMQTGRPIDVLPDRTADTMSKWLLEHPGAQIVCRDGSATYAAAITTGAPGAQQVSDRWHLWHLLGKAVEKLVIRNRADLRPPAPSAPEPAPAPEPAEPLERPSRITQRHRERFEAIHQLLGDGLTRTAIAQHLSLDPKTVSIFAGATTIEAFLASTQRTRKPDAHADHILRRWAQGCTDASILYAELRELGYEGTDRTVRRWVEPLRSGIVPPPPSPSPLPPKARHVVRWMMTDPEQLDTTEQEQLDEITKRGPAIKAALGHVQEFAKMLKTLTGQHLPQWMDKVLADDLPDLHTFAAGLKRDLAAVTAGLTLPWNSGRCEGHVNRVKMLKRQMFGRASFSLLRKRILLAS